MLVFVRHAQSIGNTANLDERAGWDIPNHMYPLTVTGKEQSRITGKWLLNKYGPDFFKIGFYSDFLRTKETFEIIDSECRLTSMRTFEDSRLNEKWDGIFHDLSVADIVTYYPMENSLRRRAGYYMYRAPGGENVPDVEMRIRSFLSEYFENFKKTNVLIVGHGRWFQIFRKVFHKLSSEEFPKLKNTSEPKNCNVHIYDNFALEQRTQGESFVPWEGILKETKTILA